MDHFKRLMTRKVLQKTNNYCRYLSSLVRSDYLNLTYQFFFIFKNKGHWNKQTLVKESHCILQNEKSITLKIIICKEINEKKRREKEI